MTDDLRGLIQLIPPARALKKELQKQMDTDLYVGIGDMAARNLEGLVKSATNLVEDEYMQTLIPQFPPDAEDREKVSFVLLAASQLIAFLEGQAGIAGMGDPDEKQHVGSTGHKVAMGNVNLRVERLEEVGEALSKMFSGTKIGEEISERIGKTIRDVAEKVSPEPQPKSDVAA